MSRHYKFRKIQTIVFQAAKSSSLRPHYSQIFLACRYGSDQKFSACGCHFGQKKPACGRSSGEKFLAVDRKCREASRRASDFGPDFWGEVFVFRAIFLRTGHFSWQNFAACGRNSGQKFPACGRTSGQKIHLTTNVRGTNSSFLPISLRKITCCNRYYRENIVKSGQSS